MVSFTDRQLILLKSKLFYLDFDNINTLDNPTSHNLRHIIIWLEENVFHLLSANKRRKDLNSSDFAGYLKNYLEKIGCCYGEDSPFEMLDFLLTHASKIKLDNSNTFSDSNNIFQNIDVFSCDFKQGVNSLAEILEIPKYNDHLERFKACCILISQKLSDDTIKSSTLTAKQDKLSLDDIILGFDVPDPDLKAIAVAARLLNISELRLLQDQINAAIVHVQKLTADPKTNEKLGQVGY